MGMAALTALTSSRSLNPCAPEFFPQCYMNIHTQTQFLFCLNPHPSHHFNLPLPLFQPPNPNYNPSSSCSSIYYSPLKTDNNNNNDASTDFPKTEPNPSVPAATGPTEDQNQLVHEPRGVEKCRNRRSRGGGYMNPKYKKECKPKVDFGTCRRHAKCVYKEKQPVLPIEQDAKSTTVMIKNIPNRYTRELLMNFLDNHCMLENEQAQVTNLSAYDFLYLPMDFESNANKGYAFVNFTEPKAAWKFHLAVNNQPWSLFHSGKICETASAKLQGKEELIRHFQSSFFKCETDEYLPVCFLPPRDGPKAKVKQIIIGRRIWVTKS